MEIVYEIIGTVILIAMASSSVFIGLFKAAFGSPNQLTDISPSNRKWHARGLTSLEYAQRCIPNTQRAKYILLLKVQRYSFYLVLCYLAVGLVHWFIFST